jgi:hypothetical protein
MIRERLLGERPPGLKKTVDRRRVRGLWLSRMQAQSLFSEIKEFSRKLSELPFAGAKPEAKPEQKQESGSEAKPANSDVSSQD